MVVEQVVAYRGGRWPPRWREPVRPAPSGARRSPDAAGSDSPLPARRGPRAPGPAPAARPRSLAELRPGSSRSRPKRPRRPSRTAGSASEIRPAVPDPGRPRSSARTSGRSRPTVRVPPGVPVPTYPVVVNAPVEALIDHFVARDRERFGMWISRSGRYLPMIQRIFRERGLPEELAYTAMIESGFSPAGGLAGRRQGDVAVHGGHGAALRPRHRPLAGRAPRPGEVHDGGGRVPRRSLRPVRPLVPGPGGIQRRARPAWDGRSSGPGRATSGR